MTTACAINGCDHAMLKRGMCNMHYLRWWRHGDPLFIPIRSYRRPVLDRLLHGAKRTPSGCLVFSGATAGEYGLIQVNNKALLAHRVSYELQVGPIPDGVLVLHKCDTPPCIEPTHLFLGTHSDNTQDMLAKERGRYQRNAPHAAH